MITLEEFKKIKTCLELHKEENKVVDSISILLTRLYGEVVKDHIINYCCKSQSVFSTDEEVVEVMNDPLSYYIDEKATPLSQLKDTFEENPTVQGLWSSIK